MGSVHRELHQAATRRQNGTKHRTACAAALFWRRRTSVVGNPQQHHDAEEDGATILLHRILATDSLNGRGLISDFKFCMLGCSLLQPSHFLLMTFLRNHGVASLKLEIVELLEMLNPRLPTPTNPLVVNSWAQTQVEVLLEATKLEKDGIAILRNLELVELERLLII